MEKVRILGVLITDRLQDAVKVQEIFTKYGCIIKTRLGMHEVYEVKCSRKGLLILELAGNNNLWDDFEKELSSVEGVEVQKMEFEYS